MKVVDDTELRLNLERYLDSVVDDVEEVVIRRGGRGDLVLLSLEEYRSLMETDYLLRGRNREVLLESIASAEAGEKRYEGLVEGE